MGSMLRNVIRLLEGLDEAKLRLVYFFIKSLQ